MGDATTVRLLMALGLVLATQGQDFGADDGPTFDKVSFYFAAHQDDWQLFMNPTAFNDVAGAKTKAVFVHMTAGDAGSGIGTRGRKHPSISRARMAPRPRSVSWRTRTVNRSTTTRPICGSTAI